MSPFHLVLAAALTGWGAPVIPSPAPEEAEPPPAPASEAPAATPAPPAPPTPRVEQLPDVDVPVFAKAPLDVRARPASLVTVQAGRDTTAEPRRLLYKDWRFWAVAGLVFAGVVVTTYFVTRPDPPPYSGNASPYIVSFP